MTPLQIIFFVVAIITLGGALMVVTTQNLVHAALWLVLSLFGIAVLFVLLDAGFFAVAQVVIYIGAIAILMIFAIMLTRRVAKDSGPQINTTWPIAGVVTLALFGSLFVVFQNWQQIHVLPPAFSEGYDPLQQLGVELVSPNGYLIPFEVASILLLAALIGAIVIAWNKNK